MSSAEMKAGIQGHAFLAEWLTNQDLEAANRAFDAAANRPPHQSKSGWLSHSALSLYRECPTKFYLQRLKGLRLRRSQKDLEQQAHDLEKEAKLAEQARDACIWLASEGLAGEREYLTAGTEVYLETGGAHHFRGLIDHLVIRKDDGALGVRDHKFTWRDDARVALRMMYSDQNLLYATAWNMRYRWPWRQNPDGVWYPHVLEAPIFPRIEYLVTNVIVVNARGNHKVMPSETCILTAEKELNFRSRLLRTTELIDAFTAQCDRSHGWQYAQEWMNTNACVVFGACPYLAICHEGKDPSDCGDMFAIGDEVDNPPEEA